MKASRKWGKVGKVATIFFTILATTAAIAYSFTDIGEAAGSFEQHRQAAIRAKLPFTAEDMNQLSEVPSEENGGIKALPALLEIKNYYEKMGNGEIPEAKALAVWTPLLPSFEVLERGSKAKYFVFPRDYHSYANNSPEYTPLFKWVRLVSTLCTIAVRAGDLDLSRRLLTFLARISILVEGNIDLDPTLLRCSCATFAEKQIRTILNTKGSDRAWREVVDNALLILDKPFDPLPMVRFYHFRALRLVDGFMGRPSGSDPDLFLTIRAAKYIPRFERANLSRIHDYFSRCVSEYPKDPYDFMAIHNHFSSLSDASWGNNVSYMFAGFCSMGFQSIDKAMAKESAQRNVLMQASKIFGGSDPDKGLPLKGRYLADADGKLLRLKKTAQGWIIYSIGPNNLDDGGNDDPNRPLDFVVHLSK